MYISFTINSLHNSHSPQPLTHKKKIDLLNTEVNASHELNKLNNKSNNKSNNILNNILNNKLNIGLHNKLHNKLNNRLNNKIK